MKILIVCSFNKKRIHTYIREQVESLNNLGIETDYYLIRGKGLFGYIRNYFPLVKKIKKFNPTLVHAHYGLSGLLASFQTLVPVITTFHGSDINNLKVRLLSIIAMKRSVYSIFVSRQMAYRASAKKDYSIISCGINLNHFKPIDKAIARQKMGYKNEDKIVVFAGSFDDKVKNVRLAQKAIQIINQNIVLVELKNYTRLEVNFLLNAADVALLTSLSEGSPNFIKEAMACNCPIVTTNVGDVSEITANIDGTFICHFDEKDVASKLTSALELKRRTNGRENILRLEMGMTARKILDIYERILN